MFAPASRDRSRIVLGTHTIAATERGEAAATGRQRAMSWAQRLKRVFAIDIETCRQCGGHLRVIASIEQPAVIERILEHLGHTADPSIRRIQAGHRRRAISWSESFVLFVTSRAAVAGTRGCWFVP